MTPSSQPNAKQKRWREAVRELGSVISGGPAVIHHPVGRTAKHNKVEIGHWWVLPLTDQEHKDLHNGLTPWSRVYLREGRKEFEKWAFRQVLFRLRILDGSENWPTDEAIFAIEDYRR